MAANIQYLVSKRLQAIGVRHGFFMRYGGVSTGLFSSLNGKKDNGDSDSNVDENRFRAVTELSDSNEYAHIIHEFKDHILDATAPGEFKGYDASITKSPDFVLSQTTADCGTIILSSSSGKVVALIHGSWHTLKANIVSKTIQKLRTKTDEAVIVAIGPMICKNCYEFGPEAQVLFDQKYLIAKEDKYLVDLKQMIIDQLHENGVNQIDDLGICTFEDERFFSHRRTTEENGRFITLVKVSKSV